MSVPSEVRRLEQRLDQAFGRAGAVSDVELLSDCAKHLCVLVSGYLEQSIVEILLAHARSRSAPSVSSHLEYELRRKTNLNATKLIALVGTFSADWKKAAESYICDERKAAVDSVVNLRNTISHGRQTNVTLVSVRNYYAHVKDVVAFLAGVAQ